jgi:ComF family protein
MIDFAGKFLNMKRTDYLLAVPLHKVKQRQRQFNQAHLLAEGLARTFSKPLMDSLLIKARSTPAQVSLSQRERLKNILGTFKVNLKPLPILKGKTILLIDDVFTTGATANECARLLREAGAKQVDIFTLARSN